MTAFAPKQTTGNISIPLEAFAASDASSNENFTENRACRHTACTCCPNQSASHRTMNYFYIFKYGKLFCDVVVARAAGEHNSKESVKENYEWNIWRTFAARLCWEAARIAGGTVEICSAWRWWKNKLLSWHLNVCNSFHSPSNRGSTMTKPVTTWCMGTLTGGCSHH